MVKFDEWRGDDDGNDTIAMDNVLRAGYRFGEWATGRRRGK